MVAMAEEHRHERNRVPRSNRARADRHGSWEFLPHPL